MISKIHVSSYQTKTFSLALLLVGASLTCAVSAELAPPEKAKHEKGKHEKGKHEKGKHEKGKHEKGKHEKGKHEKGKHEKAKHEKAKHEKAKHVKGKHEGGKHDKAMHPKTKHEKSHHEKTLSLQSSSDDTIVLPSLKVTNDFTDKVNDAWKNTTTLKGSYAFGGKSKHDWGINLSVPLVYVDPGEKEDATSQHGLGDLSLKLTRSFRINPKFRLAPSLKSGMNTATNDKLGVAAWTLSPAVATSYRINRHLSGLFTLTYAGSVARDTGVGRVNNLTLKPGISVSLPNHWHVASSYSGKYNFSSDNEYTESVKFQVNKLLGRHHKFDLGATFNLPLQTGSTVHSMSFSLKYNF